MIRRKFCGSLAFHKVIIGIKMRALSVNLKITVRISWKRTTYGRVGCQGYAQRLRTSSTAEIAPKNLPPPFWPVHPKLRGYRRWEIHRSSFEIMCYRQFQWVKIVTYHCQLISSGTRWVTWLIYHQGPVLSSLMHMSRFLSSGKHMRLRNNARVNFLA